MRCQQTCWLDPQFPRKFPKIRTISARNLDRLESTATGQERQFAFLSRSCSDKFPTHQLDFGPASRDYTDSTAKFLRRINSSKINDETKKKQRARDIKKARENRLSMIIDWTHMWLQHRRAFIDVRNFFQLQQRKFSCQKIIFMKSLSTPNRRQNKILNGWETVRSFTIDNLNCENKFVKDSERDL